LVNDEADEFWDRIVPLLESQRVLTEVDLDKLAHLANYHGKIRQIWDLGGKPTAPEMTQLRISMTEFGMTPASRAKVTKTGTPEKANPFKKHDRSG
jgi:phage terminase small subunit